MPQAQSQVQKFRATTPACLLLKALFGPPTGPECLMLERARHRGPHQWVGKGNRQCMPIHKKDSGQHSQGWPHALLVVQVHAHSRRRRVGRLSGTARGAPTRAPAETQNVARRRSQAPSIRLPPRPSQPFAARMLAQPAAATATQPAPSNRGKAGPPPRACAPPPRRLTPAPSPLPTGPSHTLPRALALSARPRGRAAAAAGAIARAVPPCAAAPALKAVPPLRAAAAAAAAATAAALALHIAVAARLTRLTRLAWLRWRTLAARCTLTARRTLWPPARKAHLVVQLSL